MDINLRQTAKPTNNCCDSHIRNTFQSLLDSVCEISQAVPSDHISHLLICLKRKIRLKFLAIEDNGQFVFVWGFLGNFQMKMWFSASFPQLDNNG